MPIPSAGYTITFSGVTLTAGVPKTVVGASAAASKSLKVVELSVDGDATSGSMLVELVYGTNATQAPGTVNAASAQVLSVRGSDGAELGPAINWSTEPTVLTVVKRWRFAFPGGPLVIQFPLGREPTGSTVAGAMGKFMGLRCTSSVNVTNCDGYVELEE